MSPTIPYKCGSCGAENCKLWRLYNTFLSHQRVPTPDGETFWGYSSVPPEGVAWWRALPSYLTTNKGAH